MNKQTDMRNKVIYDSQNVGIGFVLCCIDRFSFFVRRGGRERERERIISYLLGTFFYDACHRLLSDRDERYILLMHEGKTRGHKTFCSHYSLVTTVRD